MYVDFHHNDLAEDDAAARRAVAEALQFDDADIKLNQAGKLSAQQIRRLAFRVLVPFVGLVGTAVGLVSFGIALWVAGPLVATKARLMLSLGKYLMFGVGGLFLGLLGFLIKLILDSGRVFQFFTDMMEGKVAAVTGRLHASQAEGGDDRLNALTKKKSESHNCIIKGEYFGVSEEAYEALHSHVGSNYTAYVTPRSRFLVALEPAVADVNARDPFKMEYKQ